MQSSYEQKLKYYRSRIIERLQGYAEDIGPTYRLYIDSVLACDDLEQLKEMAELDLQLEYFDYIRKINSELSVFGVSLDDIKRKNQSDMETNIESSEFDNIPEVSDDEAEQCDDTDYDYDDSYEDDEDDDSEINELEESTEYMASAADNLMQMLSGLTLHESAETDDGTEETEWESDDYEDEFGLSDLASIDNLEEGESDLDEDAQDVSEVDEYGLYGEIDDDGETDDYSDDIDEDNSEYEDDSEIEDESEIDFLTDFQERLDSLSNNSETEVYDEFGNEINENNVDIDTDTDMDSMFGEIDDSDEFDDYDDTDSDNEYGDSEEDDYSSDYSLYGDIDDSDEFVDDTEEEELEGVYQENDDSEYDDFSMFGDIDDSDVYDGEDMNEFEESDESDDFNMFGEIDDSDVYDGEDIDESEYTEEDNEYDSMFGEIDDSEDDSEYEESDDDDIESLLDRQMAQYQNGELTDDDDEGYFGDIDGSGEERSTTGFAKGSIMDQYAEKNGIVAFQDKKVNDVYNGMAKVMLRGTDMVSEGVKKKFGKFFDLKH